MGGKRSVQSAVRCQGKWLFTVQVLGGQDSEKRRGEKDVTCVNLVSDLPCNATFARVCLCAFKPGGEEDGEAKG